MNRCLWVILYHSRIFHMTMACSYCQNNGSTQLSLAYQQQVFIKLVDKLSSKILEFFNHWFLFFSLWSLWFIFLSLIQWIWINSKLFLVVSFVASAIQANFRTAIKNLELRLSEQKNTMANKSEQHASLY